MAVILKVVVVGDARKEPVVAYGKVPAGQRTHLWLVKRFECIAPGLADVSRLTEAVLIDCRYYLLRFLVNGFYAGKNFVFQPFKQVRFQKLYVVFDRRFTLWFAWWWGQHNSIVKVFQIREYRVKNVKVNGEPLDPDKTYTLASHDYMLLNNGDGYTMFDGCKVLQESVKLDNQVLIDYLEETLNGKVSEKYSDPYGDGRIVAVEGFEDFR